MNEPIKIKLTPVQHAYVKELTSLHHEVVRNGGWTGHRESPQLVANKAQFAVAHYLLGAGIPVAHVSIYLGHQWEKPTDLICWKRGQQTHSGQIKIAVHGLRLADVEAGVSEQSPREKPDWRLLAGVQDDEVTIFGAVRDSGVIYADAKADPLEKGPPTIPFAAFTLGGLGQLLGSLERYRYGS